MKPSKFLLMLFIAHTHYTHADPVCAAIVMVKNEQDSIIQTLESLHKEQFENILLYDTGSTDNTIDLVKKFSNEKSHSIIIIEEAFVDFATSRNRAIKHAKRLFHDSKFFIMPDAQWQTYGSSNLFNWCNKQITTQSALVRTFYKEKNNEIEFYTPRLIGRDDTALFVGTIHETLQPQPRLCAPSSFYFVMIQTKKGLTKTKQRLKQDEQLLLKALKHNPNDARSLYFLAQTYEALNDKEKAIKYYEQRTRISLNNSIEEQFAAYCKLGFFHQTLVINPQDSNWHKALTYYQKAYELLPTRAEPLVEISRLYFKKNSMHRCYLCALQACNLSYPQQAIMINKRIYNLDRWLLLAVSAWKIGKHKEAQDALAQASAYYPNDEMITQMKTLFTKV